MIIMTCNGIQCWIIHVLKLVKGIPVGKVTAILGFYDIITDSVLGVQFYRDHKQFPSEIRWYVWYRGCEVVKCKDTNNKLKKDN